MAHHNIVSELLEEKLTVHETLLNSLYQLLHIKCFDWLIQTGLELFDLATGVTGLIFFVNSACKEE